MGQPKIRVHAANRIRVLLQGIEVGLMQSLRASDEYGHEPASGIGDAKVSEYVPGMARHTINVGMMVLKAKTLFSEKLAGEDANTVLEGIVFDIEVFDKSAGGKLIRKWLDCTYVSGDIEIQKHAIVMQNAQFMAVDTKGTMLAPVIALDPAETTIVRAA